MNPKERIEQINKRQLEITDLVNKATDPAQIEALTKEALELTNERAKLMEQIRSQAINAFNNGQIVVTPNAAAAAQDAEQRVSALRANRSITIDALDILHTQQVSNELSQTFNPVSKLVDRVRIVQAPGMESYSKGFMKGNSTADYTAEGAQANAGEPSWGYAQITKAKLTVYTEVPEEFEKLAAPMYLAEIKRNLSVSMRKKLAMEILKGAGGTNKLVGIFNATYAAAIETSKDIPLAAIDEHTLDTIMFGFGGDEDMEYGVLILSKADLKEFGKVRGTDKKKVYNIDYKAETIDGIPYIINSNCTPLASAAPGAYVMAYGSLPSYELAVFSPMEVTKSTDYKFREGMTAYKGTALVGGNVTTWNGFVRVKKPTA